MKQLLKSILFILVLVPSSAFAIAAEGSVPSFRFDEEIYIPKPRDVVPEPTERVHITFTSDKETCPQETRTMKPNRDFSWPHSGLDISAHPEVISYKIQWNGGSWTKLIIPGTDDLDSKRNIPNDQYKDNGQRLLWSYFYDHNYELTSCADYFKKYDKVIKIERESADVSFNFQTGKLINKTNKVNNNSFDDAATDQLKMLLALQNTSPSTSPSTNYIKELWSTLKDLFWQLI